MRITVEGGRLPCGCESWAVRVLDATGKPVDGIQELDTETGHAEGLLLDAQGNASVDPQNPNEVLRTTWENLSAHCKHGKL